MLRLVDRVAPSDTPCPRCRGRDTIEIQLTLNRGGDRWCDCQQCRPSSAYRQ